MAAAADDPNKMYAVEELAPRGEKVFAANCAACHQANGQGLPPAFPPLDGSKVVLGPQDGQIDILLNGKSGTAMAAFKHLSDTELAAVITYTRNSWSNSTGEVVQPSDIKVARN
jgi:cytochrome c oxidase subunit 2